MMKKLIFIPILVLVLFLLIACTNNINEEFKDNLEEIEESSENILSEMDDLILQDCCSACTDNYGKDALPDQTSCVDVIEQSKDSIYNVRNEDTLNNCLAIFELEPKTIATCE
jgi:hypothetical protein